MPLKPLVTGQSGYIGNNEVARSWGNDWLAFGEGLLAMELEAQA